MTQHAPLSPSSAARWVKCPASVSLSAAIPEDDESESSEEGTLAHAVAAAVLQGGVLPTDGVTEEMLDGVEVYFDDVAKVKQLVGRDDLLVVEQHVDNSIISTSNHGTPDAWMLGSSTQVADVWLWDYKFGHRQVEVFENWQLINYAILIYANLKAENNAADIVHFHLRVVQPRAFHPDGVVREWVVSSDQLRPYAVKLQEAAQLALSPEPKAVINPECRDCKARHVCNELQSAGYAAVQYASVGLPIEMSPEASAIELALMQDAADVLKARISGKEQEIIQHLKLGTAVKGWSLERGTGRKRWTGTFDEITALSDMLGVEVRKTSLITPTQAIKAGIPESVVAGYSETPSGEIKLMRDNGALQRKVFNHV